MNTSSNVFELSIEPVGGATYRDGFHLGTDEVIARRLAVEAFHQRTPKVGTAIRSVALFREGKMVDCYDGHWASDLHELFHSEEPDLVVAYPGSISHGTLRHEDLLGTFADSLRNYAAIQPQRNETHIERANEAQAMADLLASGEPFDADRIGSLMEELFDALDSYSPAGHHFGAHEGDGSDFGWWPNEEEMDGWEEREAKASDPEEETAEVYLDRGFTLFDALSLPILARQRIAKALVNQTILFNA